jgi:O-antigen ligase
LVEITNEAIGSTTTPKILHIAKWLIGLGFGSLMLCIPLVNKIFPLAVLLILLSGAYLQEYKVLIKAPTIWVGLLLILLFTIGLFYSYGSWKYGFRFWDKYLKILYLLFFLPLFTKKQTRNQALYCFLIGVAICELFTFAHYFQWVTFGFPADKHWLFVHDIDASFIISFAAYLFINLAFDRKKLRGLFIVSFLICSIDILFLNMERTGYLIYLGLTVLCFLQRFHWKGLLSAVLIMPLLSTGLYFSSSLFHNRVQEIVLNLIDYQKGNKGTAIGLRLAFAESSLKMIKQHMLFGLGTGSFEEIYRSLRGPKINNDIDPTHPHNEYIHIWFQIGIVGLITYLAWIVLQVRTSLQLPQEQKFLAQGLILAFSLLGFCNASLLVNPAGTCYVAFLALFLASKNENRENKCELQ